MEHPSHRSKRFKIGIVLIVLNYAFFGLAILFGAVAASHKSAGWAIAGGASYAFSWVLIGIGILLAGPDGIRYVRSWLRPLLRRLLNRQESHAAKRGTQAPDEAPSVDL